MGVIDMIIRNCNQDAVYWSSPTNDGFGGKIFNDPIQIKCRWEDRNEVFVDPNGDEAVAKSVVFVTQELDMEGCLYLGLLDTIQDSLESSGAYADPRDVDNAFIIKRFDRVPTLGSTTQFLYKAYLTSKNMI